jgi:hypothetical protein
LQALPIWVLATTTKESIANNLVSPCFYGLSSVERVKCWGQENIARRGYAADATSMSSSMTDSSIMRGSYLSNFVNLSV